MKRFQITDVVTPVLLLRAVRHGGLCMVRSLGSAGVPVYIADSDPGSPAATSRYCRHFFRVDVDHAPAAETLQALTEAAKQIGRRAILLPTTDIAAKFVADHLEILHTNFQLVSPDRDAVHGLCSKRTMHSMAVAASVPTPDTLFPGSLEDVLSVAATVKYPVMLKPSEGQIFSKGAARTMVLVQSAQELIETYRLAPDAQKRNLMVQEYIAGGDDTVWMFDGYFQDGECLFGITGKKIRQSPVYTGATSLGICLRNDAVDGLARKLMGSVRYNGPVDMGFRYDAGDGQYKVLDVNPRIGATFRLFVDASDLDLARVIYLAATGQDVNPAVPQWGRKWLVEDTDLVSSVRYYRDKKLKFREWLISFRGVRETAYFFRGDLRPCLAILRSDTRELRRRIATKLRRKPKPPAPKKSLSPISSDTKLEIGEGIRS